MTAERSRFDTDVPGIWGLWPATPLRWSYSSLKAIETCPSQWMMSRADYPDIWERHGYPSLPVVPAIFGNVVHSVVERLAQELGAAGVTSPTSGDVVGILGSLGGWRAIVLDAIERELSAFSGNPRVGTERIDRLRQELFRRAPDAADRVKVFLARGAFPTVTMRAVSGAGARPTESRTTSRTPAAEGAHAELEVVAESLRLTGRVDLLVIDEHAVDVVDFKTGIDHDDHADQVRLYALLWYLDGEVNPARRVATALHVVYPTSESAVAAPDHGELETLERATAVRIREADAITRTSPPVANPSEENCRNCSVRHLCDAYWPAIPPSVATSPTDQWFDFEGRIVRQNGAKSWFAETVGETSAAVLIRTVETNVPFQIGRRVRLLGVRRSQDPDDPDRLVISMVGTSEWYSLVS